MSLTYFQQGASVRLAVKRRMSVHAGLVKHLVFMLDVGCVDELLSGLLRGAMRGGAAAPAAPQQLQGAVLSGTLWCQRQVKQQAVWQCSDVVQVTEGRAGAAAAVRTSMPTITVFSSFIFSVGWQWDGTSAPSPLL